jgi:hypothetical protein
MSKTRNKCPIRAVFLRKTKTNRQHRLPILARCGLPLPGASALVCAHGHDAPEQRAAFPAPRRAPRHASLPLRRRGRCARTRLPGTQLRILDARIEPAEEKKAGTKSSSTPSPRTTPTKMRSSPTHRWYVSSSAKGLAGSRGNALLPGRDRYRCGHLRRVAPWPNSCAWLTSACRGRAKIRMGHAWTLASWWENVLGARGG